MRLVGIGFAIKGHLLVPSSGEPRATRGLRGRNAPTGGTAGQPEPFARALMAKPGYFASRCKAPYGGAAENSRSGAIAGPSRLWAPCPLRRPCAPAFPVDRTRARDTPPTAIL